MGPDGDDESFRDEIRKTFFHFSQASGFSADEPFGIDAHLRKEDHHWRRRTLPASAKLLLDFPFDFSVSPVKGGEPVIVQLIQVLDHEEGSI